MQVLKDIVYSRPEASAPLGLDLMWPDRFSRPLPMVVWIHGGGWYCGGKDGCPLGPLVEKGFAVASVEYRLTPVAPHPAQIEDCFSAIRFLRSRAAEYGLGAKLGVAGDSAGGHLAMLVGATSSMGVFQNSVRPEERASVDAACPFYGVSDISTLDVPEVDFRFNKADSFLAAFLAGHPLQSSRKALHASPLNYVGPHCPPFLMFHGDADRCVHWKQSGRLHEALQVLGVESTLRIVPGAGHDFNACVDWPLMEKFFRRHLG